MVGLKYVRMYAPHAHSLLLYPHTEGLNTNSSRIDLDADFASALPLNGGEAAGVSTEGGAASPAYPQFPGFAGLPYMDCVLGPGQMLYLPPGWWHYVRSLSTSCSVSFWWK